MTVFENLYVLLHLKELKTEIMNIFHIHFPDFLAPNSKSLL